MKSDADILLEQVTAVLKETRLAKRLSHEVLARAAGVTRPAISHMESGRRRPSLLLCLKLANALGVPLSSLIAKAEKKSKAVK